MLLGCIVLVFGRLAVFLLWCFGWFATSGISTLWGILGFILMPLTLTAVAYVNMYRGGIWDTGSIVLVVITAVLDLGSGGSQGGRTGD